jgi:DNA-binding PadR family transcriptional regulator
MNKKAVTIEASQLIEFLDQELKDLPDNRKGDNKKYTVNHALKAGFSVFFTQSPSFLQHQRLMKPKKGRDNAESLFGLSEIPCDNQIRKLLDPIPAKTVFGAFKSTYKWLETNRVIKQFKYLDNQILLALDGTEYYSSKKINCPHCNCRKHKNGSVTYYHQAVTPVIVSPSKKQVINFPPEFIKKQDGKTKQDCENIAVKRWLLKNFVEREKNQITLLGDDLYSRQPICELALEQGYNFIFVAKPSSHKTLYEWLDVLEKNGELTTGEIKNYEKGKRRIYRYRAVNKVLLRETEPSLIVNWYEVEILDTAKNKVIYQNSFITNHELNEQNIFSIIVSGRTRWKVENESNNILKNQGYNLEHNFGHGQENLSEILLSLNLLAFLFHNVLDLVNSIYQKVRKSLGARKRFFNDIRALLNYVWFQSWNDLFIFILTEGDERELVNTS